MVVRCDRRSCFNFSAPRHAVEVCGTELIRSQGPSFRLHNLITSDFLRRAATVTTVSVTDWQTWGSWLRIDWRRPVTGTIWTGPNNYYVRLPADLPYILPNLSTPTCPESCLSNKILLYSVTLRRLPLHLIPFRVLFDFTKSLTRNQMPTSYMALQGNTNRWQGSWTPEEVHLVTPPHLSDSTVL